MKATPRPAKRTLSLEGDPAPKVHASVTYSYVIGSRVYDGTKTACGRDDDELEVTVLRGNVTCKACLTWCEKHDIST